MDAIKHHADEATTIGTRTRISGFSFNPGRWSTPSAPLFDKTSAPRTNTYRPQSDTTSAVDASIARDVRAVSTSRKAARKLHAKVSAKAATVARFVTLRRPDGVAIRHSTDTRFGGRKAATVKVDTRPLSRKVAATEHGVVTEPRPKVGTFYPPLPRS